MVNVRLACFALVLLAPRFASADVVFDGSFEHSVHVSGKWSIESSAVGWDTAAQQMLSADALAKTSSSTLFMAGSHVYAALGAQSMTIGETGGSYTATIERSVGYVCPIEHRTREDDGSRHTLSFSAVSKKWRIVCTTGDSDRRECEPCVLQHGSESAGRRVRKDGLEGGLRRGRL